MRGAIGSNINSIDDAALDGIDSGGLKQKLILRFACTDLPNLDTYSLTDAFVVVWLMKGRTKQKVGQTECIDDNLNPEFVTAVQVDYHFEEQ